MALWKTNRIQKNQNLEVSLKMDPQHQESPKSKYDYSTESSTYHSEKELESNPFYPITHWPTTTEGFDLSNFTNFALARFFRGILFGNLFISIFFIFVVSRYK